jgi:hypothetical protein
MQVRGYAPIGTLEFWNIGIMGFSLRLGEHNGTVGLEKQNEHNSIDFLIIVG